MRLSFHPSVQQDVNGIPAPYHKQGGERLADRFFEELTARFKEIEESPQSFAFYLGGGRSAEPGFGDSPI